MVTVPFVSTWEVSGWLVSIIEFLFLYNLNIISDRQQKHISHPQEKREEKTNKKKKKKKQKQKQKQNNGRLKMPYEFGKGMPTTT